MEATLVTATGIIGSWFPSGFHGFNKNSTRHDMNTLYRELAKPNPPKKFMLLVKQNPSDHPFSIPENQKKYKFYTKFHDARQIRTQPNNVPYISNERPVPLSGPYISTYRHTYCNSSNTFQPHNILSFVPHECEYPSTTYQFMHGDANPYKNLISKKNKTLQESNIFIKSPKLPLRQTFAPSDTVALCLQWNC